MKYSIILAAAIAAASGMANAEGAVESGEAETETILEAVEGNEGGENGAEGTETEGEGSEELPIVIEGEGGEEGSEGGEEGSEGGEEGSEGGEEGSEGG